MCGIAGYFGKKRLDHDRLQKCSNLMRRRGPDDEGLLKRDTDDGRRLYLLHSRLSIIDLHSRARQPFTCRGDILCYNGEVYNYLEVRSQLRGRGAKFQTESDTEVLAKLLNYDGISGVSECEGMWAFAWFDAAHQQLHLCRDRFGEKPLYFYEDLDGVYFGSEPKFIFTLLGRKLPINQVQLRRYLVNGYKSLYKGSDTFFEGLRAVAPGSYRTFDAGGERDTFYWQPSFDTQDETMNYADAVALTRDALVNAVKLRLRSDVPIAFCLSGGIDSNALISIARRQLRYDVHGFTIVNTDGRYEESELVNVAVRDLGLRHTEVRASPDHFMDNLRILIKYHDAPVYTISYYAQWRLMQAVSETGYKVSVSGTAADELFSGYFDHHNAYLAAMKVEDQVRYNEALSEWQTLVAPIVRNPFLQDPHYFINNPGAREHIYLGADIFSQMLYEPFSEPFSEVVYSNTLLRNRMANELRHETVPVILHEDDLNAMYYSIENRSPFLDKALFELAQNIPTRHLVQSGRAKSVLRDAIRGIAPDQVVESPRKVGFNAPLTDYLNIDNPKVREEILDNSSIYEIVKIEEIKALLLEKNLPNSRSKFLFNFICAKMFLEEYSTQSEA